MIKTSIRRWLPPSNLLILKLTSRIRRRLPPSVLLRFPFVYKLPFVKYESLLQEANGIEDLLTKLDRVMKLNGDIIECGSAYCGTSIIIANYLRAKGTTKRVYALDFFGAGFDLHELEEERRLGLTAIKDDAFTVGYSYEYVKKKIDRLGLSDTIIPVKGHFRDTLPDIDSEFCLTLIDCDLKNSITYCVETIWPRVPKNGIILFDDYETYDIFRGPKIAIDEFLDKHKNEISEHGMLNRLYYIVKNS